MSDREQALREVAAEWEKPGDRIVWATDKAERVIQLDRALRDADYDVETLLSYLIPHGAEQHQAVKMNRRLADRRKLLEGK